MDGISVADLLTCWERVLSRTPAERAVGMLGAALPEASGDELAEWSVGRRDAALLRLRERLFGPMLSAAAACPRCHVSVELSFAVGDILVSAPEDASKSLSFTHDEFAIEFRLPNSMDMALVTADLDAAGNVHRLLSRCAKRIERSGECIPFEETPEEIKVLLADRIAAADPQADIQLALTCPDCSQQWHAPFDIVSYLWTELDAWARRIVGEVHTLATAYGWCEADILAMSQIRRQMYMEMVEG